MPYEGQKAGAGEVSLLPGEPEEFIFTEVDRRIARQAIKESKDDKGMDIGVAHRLCELVTVGNSFQASVLLTELVESSYGEKTRK